MTPEISSLERHCCLLHGCTTMELASAIASGTLQVPDDAGNDWLQAFEKAYRLYLKEHKPELLKEERLLQRGRIGSRELIHMASSSRFDLAELAFLISISSRH